MSRLNGEKQKIIRHRYPAKCQTDLLKLLGVFHVLFYTDSIELQVQRKFTELLNVTTTSLLPSVCADDRGGVIGGGGGVFFLFNDGQRTKYIGLQSQNKGNLATADGQKINGIAKRGCIASKKRRGFALFLILSLLETSYHMDHDG